MFKSALFEGKALTLFRTALEEEDYSLDENDLLEAERIQDYQLVAE